MLIESDPSLQVALRLRHRHILVDEYQDVNRASARLLKAVAGDGKHLWVVGDSRQSIYRFRGASSSNMALFASDYANAASDQLSVNYRSSRQIVSTFLAVAPHMGASAGMLPLALTAERGEGPANPEIRRFDMLEDEAGGLAASIREVETRGVSLRDQAVLCRTNGRLNEIAEALEARGLPVLHLGSLFERDEVRDLLALLSLAIDRLGTGLTRVGAMARYDLSLQDVYLVISRLKEVAERPALTSLSVWATTEGLSKAGAEGFARLARDLEGLSSSLSAWEFLAEYLLDRAELIREMARRESVPDRMRSVAIWQFLNFVREQSPVSSGPRIQRTLDRVRQLVLLAEERDLRQVPAGALHMNAVRLMTVHGSKGLEFEAVHIPGLTAVSFPSSYHPPRCLPPVGMIEGVDGLTVEEEAKESQEHEEQCLFFVALSRARTHLRLYLARLQPNGRNRRSPSVFLDWMPTQDVVEISDPEKMALPGGVGKGNAVRVTHTADSSITDSSLSAYQKCPRRYFYTHVFGLGTARKSTAFLRTHNCLYDLIRWLAEARRGGDTTVEAAEQAFESIWKDRGPVDHGFAADYRHLASRLIAALVSSGAGRRFRDAEPIAIDFPNGKIIVEPNEMAQLPNGTVVLRRVRTGHKRTDEYDSLEYTLYHLAGKARFGNAFSVEAIHLTDETIETVTITAQKVDNRRATSDAMLQRIGQGLFPPKIEGVVCPRCPHFFVCDAMPKGPLNLP